MTDHVIMIVEDEGIVALDLMTRIRRLGFSPIIALSGLNAIELAKESEPNLALMDIRLKGDIDGIEVATRLQHLYPIDIIYISALIDEATRQRAEKTNPIAYVEKPFSDDALLAAIYKAFS